MKMQERFGCSGVMLKKLGGFNPQDSQAMSCNVQVLRGYGLVHIKTSALYLKIGGNTLVGMSDAWNLTSGW